MRAALLLLVLALACPAFAEPTPHVTVQLENVQEDVEIVQTPDGKHIARMRTANGTVELDADQFLGRVYGEQSQRPVWMRYLNVTSALGISWVVLGLAGQLMFTGRMIVQLLSSEKSGQSVVPISFWWMSLIGASMLLIYFAWRKDLVGILGQSIGWLVYIRNIQLIYRQKRKEKPSRKGSARASKA